MPLTYIIALSTALGALASAVVWLVWRRDRKQVFARDISLWFLSSVFIGPMYSVYSQQDTLLQLAGSVGLSLAYALAHTFLLFGVRRFAVDTPIRRITALRLASALFGIYLVLLLTPWGVRLVSTVAGIIAVSAGVYLLIKLWKDGVLERLIGALVILGTSTNVVVAIGGDSVVPLALAITSAIRTALGFMFVFAALNRSHQGAAQMLQRFEQLSENALQGIMVLDAQRFYYLNPAVVQIYGYDSEADMMRAGPFATATPEIREQALAAVQRVLTGGNKINETEGIRYRKDGTPIYLRLTGWPVEWDGNPAIQLLVTDETLKRATALELQRAEEESHRLEEEHRIDLLQINASLEKKVVARTQDLALSNTHLADANLRMEHALETLRNTQAELVQREKLASLGRMVAGIAHELNTPIGNALTVGSTIRHQMRQLKSDVETGKLKKSSLSEFLETSAEGADVLQSALHKAHVLITNFRQVAQEQSDEPRSAFDLSSLLATRVALLDSSFQNSKIALVLDAVGEVQVEGYPEHLAQVLDQLIENAKMHAFADQATGKIRVQLRDQGDTVSIAVIDDGCGIARDIQDKVFDPFFTTRMGDNVGMGLNLVYTTVTGKLGGSIQLTDGAPRGTRFELQLPRVAPEGAGDEKI